MARSVPGSPYARWVAANDVLHVRRGLDLPLSEISWRATAAGGPGGQHANRTASRVEVAFDVAASATLGPLQRARITERLGPVARAVASESRSQSRNRELALERLAAKLDAALRVRTPRRETRPTKGSQVRRVESKRKRGETKRRRRPPGEHD